MFCLHSDGHRLKPPKGAIELLRISAIIALKRPEVTVNWVAAALKQPEVTVRLQIMVVIELK